MDENINGLAVLMLQIVKVIKNSLVNIKFLKELKERTGLYVSNYSPVLFVGSQIMKKYYKYWPTQIELVQLLWAGSHLAINQEFIANYTNASIGRTSVVFNNFEKNKIIKRGPIRIVDLKKLEHIRNSKGGI